MVRESGWREGRSGRRKGRERKREGERDRESALGVAKRERVETKKRERGETERRAKTGKQAVIASRAKAFLRLLLAFSLSVSVALVFRSVQRNHVDLLRAQKQEKEQQRTLSTI